MNKRHIGVLAILVAGAVRAVCAGAPMAADQPAPQIAVYFSPHGGCTDAIVKELDAAKESVLVQACSFTSAPIPEAPMVNIVTWSPTVPLRLPRPLSREPIQAAVYQVKSQIARC